MELTLIINIYSVDLIFLYIKTITSNKIKIKKLLPQLKINDWGDLSPYEIDIFYII